MKKYILLNGLSYGFLLNVGGKNYSVKFAGASINKDKSEYSKAHFSTDNKDLQAALEKSSLYGKKFVLAKNQTKNKQTETGFEENKGANSEENSVVDNTTANSNNGYKTLSSSNKQAAVEELKNLFPDIEISATAKNNEIEKIANTKGYTFPYLTKSINSNNNQNQ
jgi:hypothetical protein